MFAKKNYSQDVTAVPVVLQYHMVIFPQRRSMGHRQKRDSELGRAVHHETLNFDRYERRRFVQYGILHVQISRQRACDEDGVCGLP